jgi:hypothetical protein
MKVVYKYDSNFMYVEPVLLEPSFVEGEEVYEISDNCTDVQPLDGLYLAKFDTRRQMWVESASQEYIDSLNKKPAPNDTELLKEQNALLTSELAKTQQKLSDQSKLYADLILSLTEKGVL